MMLGRISKEDLIKFREVSALVEVARSPPLDMTTETAQQAWMAYYAMVADLHERYDVPEEDRLNVVITTGSGLIVFEEE